MTVNYIHVNQISHTVGDFHLVLIAWAHFTCIVKRTYVLRFYNRLSTPARKSVSASRASCVRYVRVQIAHSCIVHSRIVHPCHTVLISPLLHCPLPQIQRSPYSQCNSVTAACTGGCSRRCAWVSADEASTSTPATASCSTSCRSTPSDTATPTTGRRGWSPVRRTRRTPDARFTGTQTRRWLAASLLRSRCRSKNSSSPTTTSTRTHTYVCHAPYAAQFCAALSQNKKLSYRRGTARCVVSVEILPIATQQCRNYLYDKSWTKYQLSRQNRAVDSAWRSVR